MKKQNINYVPDSENRTPDYYCTWQTQLYATCDGKPEEQRACITENALFGTEKPFGWTEFYPDARRDMYFIMDDSWDVPLKNYSDYHGSMVLNADKFPSFADAKNPAKALKTLNDAVKAKGWKGVGGWVCAQESPLFSEGKSQEEYWTERLLWCKEAGIPYWKVDWGKLCRVPAFREGLTALAHKVAPSVTIESALVPSVIPRSDVFRTYDVPAIMSIPMTLTKLAEMLNYTADGCSALINCEDEAYIGAALGCCIGIMRHPYAGNFVNGKPDMSFPSVHRNLKTKMDEVTRAVRWHRIAPAFSVSQKDTYISNLNLTDGWEFENLEAELESWWPNALGLDTTTPDRLKKSGPAAISRGMPLPAISAKDGVLPYCVCAQNPNGAVSIATLGRTLGRDYFIPKCDVKIKGKNADTFGIFGAYNTLTIQSTRDLSGAKIIAQDLAADFSFDITADVTVNGKLLILPGELIEQIGNSSRHDGDTSEAGMLLKLI